MKCIQKHGDIIIRVSNEEAARKVRENTGWQYCRKLAYKEANTRRTK